MRSSDGDETISTLASDSGDELFLHFGEDPSYRYIEVDRELVRPSKPDYFRRLSVVTASTGLILLGVGLALWSTDVLQPIRDSRKEPSVGRQVVQQWVSNGQNRSAKSVPIQFPGPKAAPASGSDFASPSGFTYVAQDAPSGTISVRTGKGRTRVKELSEVDAAEAARNAAALKRTEIATCVVDVSEATATLGEAGLSIDAVITACRKVEPPLEATTEEKAACAASISSIGTTIAHVGSFLSGAAALCGKTVNMKAMCSEDINSLVAILFDIAGSGASMSQTCSEDRKAPSSQPVSRRLHLNGLTAESTDETAGCVFSGTLAALALARAGLDINFGKLACPANEQIACATDISGVVESFASAAELLSSMAHTCSKATNTQALCASDVQSTIAITSGLVSASASMSETCRPNPPDPEEHPQDVPNIGTE